MKQMWISFVGSFLMAGVFLGIVDSMLLVVSREMFFDVTELLSAMGCTLAIDAAVGVLVGFAAFGTRSAFNALLATVGWQERPVLRTVAAASALFGPAVFGLLRLFSGPQASQIPGRVPLVILLGAAAAGGCGFLLAWAPLKAGETVRLRRGWAIFFFGLSAAATAADLWVLIRLYPLFHGVLSLVALVSAGWGGVLWTLPGRSRRKAVWGAIFAAVVAAGAIAAFRVSNTQNIRFVIGDVTINASEVTARLRRSGGIDDGGDDRDGELPAVVNSRGNALSLPGADVFLITVDAMRYDRLKALGARREVAPNIDKFAESAVLFSRAYTPIPHTSYALTSLLTGKFTRPLFDVPGAPSVHETWPEVMRRFRYDSAAFFTPAVFFIDRARFEPYYRKGVGFLYRKVEAKHSAAERTATLTAYLDEKADTGRPLFAWIHYFEPHEPYDEACTRFGTGAEDRYDCEVWTVDKSIGELLAYIDAHRPGAVVIVTADHGEEFGDHGGAYHGTTLFDEQVRVPLVMRIPGVSPGRVDAPVSLTDLMGTVLRIVDIPMPARIRSRDLTGVLLGDDAPLDAFAEAHDEAMVVFDGYKIICKTDGDLCRLYDLEKDPRETRSVAEQVPERTAAMKKRLAAWRRSHARYELRPVSTAKDGEKWPSAISRALGGDLSVLDDLLAVVATSREGAIRRKASELAFRIADEMPENLPLLDTEPDVEVAAWLHTIRAKFGDAASAAYLARETEKLNPRCEAFRAATLVRGALGDEGAYDQLLTLALDDTAAVEARKQALGYIGGMSIRGTAEQMIPLINQYQLTLDAAAALGRLKLKAAVEPLVVRLKRERFLERKAAIISALAEIGDWRAVPAVTDALYNDTPPPGSLSALSQMTDRSPFGRRIPSSVSGRETVFYRPVPKEPIRVFLKTVDRTVVRVRAEADGGTVEVRCGGEVMGEIPLNAGSREAAVSLSECTKQKSGGAFVIQFTPVGVGPDNVAFEAAAVLRDADSVSDN